MYSRINYLLFNYYFYNSRIIYFINNSRTSLPFVDLKTSDLKRRFLPLYVEKHKHVVHFSWVEKQISSQV